MVCCQDRASSARRSRTAVSHRLLTLVSSYDLCPTSAIFSLFPKKICSALYLHPPHFSSCLACSSVAASTEAPLILPLHGAKLVLVCQ